MNNYSDINQSHNNQIPNIYSYSFILNEISVYKHVNFFFLKNMLEHGEEYKRRIEMEKILPKMNLGNGLNFYIKYLYYISYFGAINLNNNILYREIKSFNSKQTFEELNDENSINILLHHDGNIQDHSIKVFYNKDINCDIFTFNFENPEKINFSNVIKKIIEINTLNLDLKRSIRETLYSDNLLDNVIKINKSYSVNFARLYTKSLDNLEKLNKIFSLYESIRSIDKIKEKVSH